MMSAATRSISRTGTNLGLTASVQIAHTRDLTQMSNGSFSVLVCGTCYQLLTDLSRRPVLAS